MYERVDRRYENWNEEAEVESDGEAWSQKNNFWHLNVHLLMILR